MIDTHVHITPKVAIGIHHSISLEQYAEQASKFGINHAIVCLNPFVKGYLCPDDKSHKVFVHQTSDETYEVRCTNCGKLIYAGYDVFFEHNQALCLECNTAPFEIGALAFVVAPFKILDKLIAKYEQIDGFCGYKIHPTICNQSISDIPIVPSEKPILFHSGVGNNENPALEVEFAKKYKGNVIIAHCARFNKKVLNQIRESDNIWIDTSPFSFLWNLYESKRHKLYLDESCLISNPSELMKYVIDEVGIEKIIFSSDAPFGDVTKEILFFNDLGLSKEEYSQITSKNGYTAYKFNKSL